jgi:hypothetical protein
MTAICTVTYHTKKACKNKGEGRRYHSWQSAGWGLIPFFELILIMYSYMPLPGLVHYYADAEDGKDGLKPER